MARYRSKPIILDALQLNLGNVAELSSLIAKSKFRDGDPQFIYLDENNKPVEKGNSTNIGIKIPTAWGTLTAVPDDWILLGFDDRLYIRKDEDFHKLFEPLDNDIRL